MKRILWIGFLCGLATACATPWQSTRADRRQAIDEMRTDVLAQLVRANPAASERLKRAEGYAVFSNVQLQLFALGGGLGSGVAHDNRNGSDVYMRMAEVDVGIGLALQEMRVVFVFHDRSAFRLFTDRGWEFGVESGASAVAGGDVGAAIGARGSVAGGAGNAGVASQVGGNADAQAARSAAIEVFQFTENGLALHANVAGTKYWKDADLN